MSSCTFLKVKQFNGDVKYINPDRIRSFDSYSEELTNVVFSDTDSLVINMPVETFVTMLQELDFYIKKMAKYD